jgi:hypothetical protein
MAEMLTIKETVTVLEERVLYLKAGIAKLNKKAMKLGCEPLDLVFDTSTRTQLYVLRNGEVIDDTKVHMFPASKIRRTYFTIEATLEYQIPIIDGWELISTFDITPRTVVRGKDGAMEMNELGTPIYHERVVFTSTVPNKYLPQKYHGKKEIHCDHCGHRRFRTHSMLMKHVATGEYKEVGSTCVKDFFGHDPKGLLWMAQLSFLAFVNNDEEEFYAGGSGFEMMHLDTLLQYTALAIRLDGWVSKKYAIDFEKTSTVDSMYFYMDPPKNHKGKKEEPSKEDIKLADDTFKHYSELDPGDNDYLANCCKVVKLGAVPDKMVGVACSMIATYKQFYKERLERKARPESSWVGKNLEKLEIKVLCVWSREFRTDYGLSVLYIFVEEATGNKFKTFYSGHKWTVYQGETMILKGTVKGHETYKGEKSTSLTRCSVIDIVEAPAKKVSNA